MILNFAVARQCRVRVSHDVGGSSVVRVENGGSGPPRHLALELARAKAPPWSAAALEPWKCTEEEPT